MKKVEMWQAEDGEQFFTEASCLQHEAECSAQKRAQELLQAGATLYAVHTQARGAASDVSDEDKALLRRITKDTKLIIGHWQCSDEPVYSVARVGLSGDTYYVGGVGGWTGDYGRYVQMRDLLRYARVTESVGKLVAS